jgi:hypothetical protein
MHSLGLGLLAGAVASGAPPSALAGYLNKDSLPEVLQANPQAVDREVLKSGKVQDALKEITFFVSVVKEVSRPRQIRLLRSFYVCLSVFVGNRKWVVGSKNTSQRSPPLFHPPDQNVE